MMKDSYVGSWLTCSVAAAFLLVSFMVDVSDFTETSALATAFVAPFVHTNPLDMLVSVIILALFGPDVEHAHGRWTFGALLIAGSAVMLSVFAGFAGIIVFGGIAGVYAVVAWTPTRKNIPTALDVRTVIIVAETCAAIPYHFVMGNIVAVQQSLVRTAIFAASFGVYLLWERQKERTLSVRTG